MKYIILLLLSLTLTIGGYAQSPYQGVTTVSADGVVFNVKFREYSFRLSNAANTDAGNPPLYYKDGRELETLDEYEVLDARQLPGGQSRAIREAFGDAVIASLRRYNECPLRMFYVIGPDGDTLEVSFFMDNVPEFVSLAPEAFAALDRNLKKYVKWEPNAYARQVKYFHGMACINFNNIPLQSELITIKEDVDFDSDNEIAE